MKSVVEGQNIVVLKADMTEESEEIDNKLVEFGNTAKAIPYYAVYRPDEAPHHFDGNFVADGAKGFLDRAGITSSNPRTGELASQPYTKAAVEKNLAKGKPVLVCFGADWDLVSKMNEKSALNSELTRSVFQENGVVVLKADMTDESSAAAELLTELGNTTRGIPYYVLFRLGQEPHDFDGNFTADGARGFLKAAGLLPEAGIRKVNGEITKL